MTTEIKPFSMGYILRVTAKNMRKSIDFSIRKTFERIGEFDNNPERLKKFSLHCLICMHYANSWMISSCKTKNNLKANTNVQIRKF